MWHFDLIWSVLMNHQIHLNKFKEYINYKSLPQGNYQFSSFARGHCFQGITANL